MMIILKKINKDIINRFYKITKQKGQWCPNCLSYFLEDDEEMCQICGWPYNN